MTMAVHLFVYGTLMRGYVNHTRCASGYAECIEAETIGTLHQHEAGYPLLVVESPELCVRGSRDPAVDAARWASAQQRCWTIQNDGTPAVHGELLTFTGDLSERMRRLDELEWYFGEDDDRSEYWRVLRAVRCSDGRVAPAWMYVVPAGRDVSGWPVIAVGRWGGERGTAADRVV